VNNWKSPHSFLLAIAMAGSALGAGIIILGFFLTGKDASTPSEVNFFGIMVKSGSLGFICIIIGAAVAVLTFNRVLKSYDKLQVDLSENSKEALGDVTAKSSKPMVDLSGFWEMRDWRNDYHYEHRSLIKSTAWEKNDRSRKTCRDVEFAKDGASVTCNFCHYDYNGDMVSYVFEGNLEGLILTGTWREVIDGGKDKTAWFGTVQFLVEDGRDERAMLGRWTGAGSRMKYINSGVWEWREQKAKGQSPKRKWPSEEADRDILRIMMPDIEDFKLPLPKPGEPRLDDYDNLFWERLAMHPGTRQEFEKVRDGKSCDWENLKSPHKDICIWYHNESAIVLEEDAIDSTEVEE
jgi:hypothetical protein